MLIDTNSHINDEKLVDTLDDILNNLSAGRVRGVICPSCSLSGCASSLKVAQNGRVWAALGIHPENCAEFDKAAYDWLDNALSNDKVVAVGEIGLDYHYGTHDRDLQHKVLSLQLDLAIKHDLPVVFHMRDAWDDCLKILKEYRGKIKRGVIHCFDGNSDIARQIIDLGYYISVTGLITYPKNDSVRESIKIIPHDRLMVEPDAPYLAPQKYRGKTNRPEYVTEVADMVASLWELDSNTTDEILTQNAKKFYGIKEKNIE